MKIFRLITALFLSSCGNVNQQNDTTILKSSSKSGFSEIHIVDRNDKKLEILLTCVVSKSNIKIEKQKLILDNIDPDGLNSMDVFDPSGDYNSGQVYDKTKGDFIIRIFIPYELKQEKVHYVGLKIIEKSKEQKNLFNSILR